MSDSELDVKWMQYAMALAEKAEAQGEIPVGAVIVKEDEVLGEGWNQPITLHDSTAHAEIVAIRNAGKNIANYRLVGSTIYVTLEPCPMCAGAIIHSRIARLVYGAQDYKTGAVGSVMNLLQHDSNNHKVDFTSGLLEQQCSHQISAFFKKRRVEIKAAKENKTLKDDVNIDDDQID
ncbi:tRNA adenosine(34) deaminase TadA [Psychrosphaera sp. B3R10]|uniref:tRNA adenosine(34) deaminase TadA n=1 Tax=unclassified Psychrosphaera TaxID=2641570 RepID=UPI001C08B210|nr:MULTISPECIES: tRNA adenosine(34) deaminase TadA [unclassified Psychrosphaera]MBU2881409.1 tRNA adenosine(34) deaminase TadA [Psychrosphaera sp. I2R16]MBU2989579.1 tRNA adenosine(34) deaminase TadA [Psychrosphaera sp. B3R10]MDO6719296.1 tRNA adenosine(34) deaminase TadA [Psychrosphaera sp. 1_MG-2023]